MCNEFAQERAWREYCEMMAREAMGIISDEPPELPFGSIHPSERAAIIRAARGGSRLDPMAWGWPPRQGRGLIINLRSETRQDPPASRGIAPMNRFYEDRGAKPPKSKFEFTPATNEPLGLAVIVKDGRFALVTAEPGPDVLGIHHRMPVTLRASDWPRYLTSASWPADITVPAPAGTLHSLQVR
ncbi:MAG: SOS response-associated peptidase family protein [Caulobacteraceae bacterium]